MGLGVLKNFELFLSMRPGNERAGCEVEGVILRQWTLILVLNLANDKVLFLSFSVWFGFNFWFNKIFFFYVRS